MVRCGASATIGAVLMGQKAQTQYLWNCKANALNQISQIDQNCWCTRQHSTNGVIVKYQRWDLLHHKGSGLSLAFMTTSELKFAHNEFASTVGSRVYKFRLWISQMWIELGMMHVAITFRILASFLFSCCWEKLSAWHTPNRKHVDATEHLPSSSGSSRGSGVMNKAQIDTWEVASLEPSEQKLMFWAIARHHWYNTVYCTTTSNSVSWWESFSLCFPSSEHIWRCGIGKKQHRRHHDFMVGYLTTHWYTVINLVIVTGINRKTRNTLLSMQ